LGAIAFRIAVSLGPAEGLGIATLPSARAFRADAAWTPTVCAGSRGRRSERIFHVPLFWQSFSFPHSAWEPGSKTASCRNGVTSPSGQSSALPAGPRYPGTGCRRARCTQVGRGTPVAEPPAVVGRWRLLHLLGSLFSPRWPGYPLPLSRTGKRGAH